MRLEWNGARSADLTAAGPLLSGESPLASGDTLLQDRGLNDGATIACLKRDLGVDVVFGLRKDHLSYGYALAQACVRPKSQWQRHPRRQRQEITRVKEIGNGPLWETLTVPIHGWVVREREEQEPDGSKYWVFGSTNLKQTASGIILW